MAMSADDRGPEGISGWLALVALQCSSAAIFSVFDAARIFQGLWSPKFTTIAPFVLSALLVAGISVGANVMATILLFTKSNRFPAVFIASLILRIGKNLFEILTIKQISSSPIDPAPLIGSVVYAGILIPYILRSKRIHNTYSSHNSRYISATSRYIESIILSFEIFIRVIVLCAQLVFPVLAFAGWCQHIYTCFRGSSYVFGIVGALLPPIGIVHGWGIWVGFWR